MDDLFSKKIFNNLSNNKKREIKLEIGEQKTGGYFFLKDNNFSNFIKMRLKSLENAYNGVIDQDAIFRPLNYVSPDYFHIFGMINVVDTNNIYLYSNINGNNDVSLKLNLEHVGRYSLFSGQVVAIKGKNLGNDEFVVEKIHCIPSVEMNSCTITDDCKLRIIFGEVDEIPLEGVDVLLLINVNLYKHKNLLEDWVKADEKARKIIVIPVLGDDYSVNVYPQVMINNFSRYFEFGTNPFQFSLNKKIISINTLDILSQIKKEEVTFCPKKSDRYFNQNDDDLCGKVLFTGDRIDRLCHHILYQNSYLPVIMSDVNIQYDSQALVMGNCPDIYILKSKLEPFNKHIGKTEIINIGNETIVDVEIKKESEQNNV